MSYQDLIDKAIQGFDLDNDADDEGEYEPAPTAPRAALPAHGPADNAEAIKIAEALEYIGSRGVSNLLKVAEAPGTDESTPLRGPHMQSTTKQHGRAPHVPSARTAGAPADDYARIKHKPSYTTDFEHGTHHPALASNEAAINFDRRETIKRTGPALKALFNSPVYADTKLRENITDAAAKGDPNIYATKTAAALDPEALRAELRRRQALGGK